jgi:hypothetical protein
MSDQPAQNPLAVASLVTGVLSIPCVCACYGFPFNLLAIVLGAVALVQAGDNPNGKGMAYGGIGLGVLSLLLAVLMFVLAFTGGFMGALLEEL